MTSLSGARSAQILHNLGWPAVVPFSHQVRCFQSGWAYGDPLTADGVVGPLTGAALVQAESYRAAGKGTASPHFTFAEMACRCGGEYGCDVIWAIRPLFLAMERLRSFAYPDGLRVVSGCRCPQRNLHVGGKPNSQHLFGAGVDVPPVVHSAGVESLHAFSGIGFGKASGEVVHVDVRHESPNHNFTSSTTASPAIFVDGP